MIKKIIAIADIHIPTYKRIEEYEIQLNDLIESVKKEISDKEKEESRILILGDLFHNKNQITNECITIASNFIRSMSDITKVIVIAGNHDLILQNQNRLDTMTALFDTAKFNNAIFLDKITNYDSSFVVDENIVWTLWSIYNDYAPIDATVIKSKYPNKKVIGLFHGTVVGCVMNNGYGADSGIDGNMFEGCDIVLGGDIHKRQILKKKGVEIIYCGSFIQQNFGETLTQHGFLEINIDDNENISHKYIDLNTDYGFYNIEINSIEDIEKDKEKIINL